MQKMSKLCTLIEKWNRKTERGLGLLSSGMGPAAGRLLDSETLSYARRAG